MCGQKFKYISFLFFVLDWSRQPNQESMPTQGARRLFHESVFYLGAFNGDPAESGVEPSPVGPLL